MFSGFAWARHWHGYLCRGIGCPIGCLWRLTGRGIGIVDCVDVLADRAGVFGYDIIVFGIVVVLVSTA